MSGAQPTDVDIRPWSEGDLALLERLMGDPAMTEHLGGPETPEKIRERHARYCRTGESDDGRMFVIVTGPDRVAAGSIGYWEKEWRGQHVWETGWSVLPEFQGRGIATRATTAVVERARAEGKQRSMHAFPSVDNGPSNAICRKAGFTLLEEVEFEYPRGHLMRCNDWCVDLFAGRSEAASTNPDVKRFDRWAATYDRSIIQRLYFGPVHSKMLDLLAKAGPTDPPRCIIDVGCGTGRLLRAASSRWPEAQLFGVDPAEQMVSEASRLNPNATFKLASAESLPFPDQTADIVLSSLAFHHWVDQHKGLQEIARVLRPGGLLCLADHTVLLARLSGEKVKSRDQIRVLMMSAGLAIQHQKRLGTRFVLITLAQMGGNHA